MEQDDLLTNLRDFFISQYGIKNDTSKTFLAFEPLAHMIVAEDFQFEGKFSPEIAADELSRMSDKIPEVNDVFIPDGTRTLSGSYGELISSIQFTDRNITGAPAAYIGKFGIMKSLADRLYENGRQASTENGPMESIYLTRGTPSGWYDTNSTIWSPKTITKTTTQTNTPTGGKNPAPTNSKLVWKNTIAANKLSQNSQINDIIKSPVMVSKINIAAEKAVPKASATMFSAAMKTSAVASPATATAVKPASSAATFAMPASSIPAATTVSAAVQLNKVPTIDKTVYRAMNSVVPFRQKVLLNRTVGTLDVTETKEVKSTNFQLDFSYTLVNLERSWISSEVIDGATLWFALTHKSGYYSTGDLNEVNKGAMRAFPKAMIVVKDLSITAQWTDEDRKMAETSIGLGCINLAKSSFSATNKNQLLAPGIMILGWICEVFPKLPINDDVNVN